MAIKNLKCYQMTVCDGDKKASKDKVEKLVRFILDPSKNEEISVLTNETRLISHEEKTTNKHGLVHKELFKLEVLNKLDDNTELIFFRIAKTKDVEGVLKRNKTTLIGEGILDGDEQKVYELEICSYVMIDIKNNVIIEMNGQYAPNARMLVNILNNQLKNKVENLHFGINYIMSDEIIDNLKDKGNKLNKIGYTYSMPKPEVLKQMGLDLKQIAVLKDLDGLKVDIIIKQDPRIPITKEDEKISNIIGAFKDCSKQIKETLFFEGSTKSASQNKKYTFNKENVTYKVDIQSFKIEDGLKKYYTLKDVEKQVYDKIKEIYFKNKEDLLKYI